ncbi:MAG: hypothetical protein CVU46_03845 [Chloroflexi bacterium HGW-Chloroflexi-8]|nr:MAG: hypothetical protein CVU46_03845 [Chloroflexi bacterium HGW-Chloroflexi-8]
MVQRLMENEFDEDFDFGSIKGLDRLQSMNKKDGRPTNKPGLRQLEKHQDVGETDFTGENFDFQYCASRYEQGWLTESLGDFYEQHWIKDVLRMIKGGKEASVYQCLADDSTDTIFLAAKVYRPKQFRNLKNDFVYRENRDYLDENGHVIRDTRMNHAIRKKTNYGQQLTHISWIEHEIKTMDILKKERKLSEIVRLVGPDALPDEQRLILLTADMIKNGFLQQSSFDTVDMYCAPPKQTFLLTCILTFHELAENAIKNGAPLLKISALPIKEKIIRLKSTLENNKVQEGQAVIQEIQQAFTQLGVGAQGGLSI